MHDYYKQIQYIPLVDTNGSVVGQGERWDVHKKGILHKGFTVTLVYNDVIILQKRKHPVFDHVIDVTCSSHPLMIDGAMEDEVDVVVRCLKREWDIDLINKNRIENRGSIVYKASDGANHIEHEYCTFYQVSIDKIPFSNLEYSYGYELVERNYLLKNTERFALAPWVQSGIELL